MRKRLIILILLLCSIPAIVFGADVLEGDELISYATNRSFFYCIIAVLMLGLIACLIYRKVNIKEQYMVAIIYIILIAGIIMRLIIAYNTEGWGNDISSFRAWALNASSDFYHFYSSGANGSAAYTPAYIYVLAVIGGLLNVFNAGAGGLMQLLIKLPPIIADAGLALLLFKTFRRRFLPQVNIALVLLIVFNPLLVFNSSVWGQVDSIFVLLLAVTLIFMAKDKQWVIGSLHIDYIYISTFFMAVTLLFKPQAIFFMPILLFELIRRKNINQLLISAAIGIVTFFLFSLPFAFPAKSTAFPLGGTPLWIINLYTNAGESYKYASVNTLNFFGMLGKNWVDDSQTFMFGLDYNVWGYIFMGIGYLFSAVVFFAATMKRSVVAGLTSSVTAEKSKANFAVISSIFITPILMNIGFFMFGARMHERYMVPAAILLIFAFSYIKDVRLLISFIGFTITNFMNLLYLMLLAYNKSPWINQINLFVIGFSALSVALALFTFYTAFDILVLDHRVGVKWIAHEEPVLKKGSRKAGRR